MYLAGYLPVLVVLGGRVFSGRVLGGGDSGWKDLSLFVRLIAYWLF